MKILLTGGHLAPALALIENLSLDKKNNIVFVGRKYALETEKTLSLEYKEIEKKSIKFIPIETGRLKRYLSLKTLQSIIKIPAGFILALKILKEEKPDIILSFGGYIALPVSLVGYFLHIPVYTHEQTVNPGLANKIISFFSKKTFISFEESKRFFDGNKVILTGNPVRQSIFKVVNKPFEIDKDKPVIYITGGSLGSHSINIHIKEILPKILGDFIVIHQAGDTKEYHDYENLLQFKDQLPENMKKDYFLKKHFFENEIGYIYSQADLIIARAGANTFFELLALKKPVIFIPLPWSANCEQQRHARIFKENNTGEIFNQFESSDKLYKLIYKVVKNLDFYKKNFINLERIFKENAAEKIIKEILADNQTLYHHS